MPAHSDMIMNHPRACTTAGPTRRKLRLAAFHTTTPSTIPRTSWVDGEDGAESG